MAKRFGADVALNGADLSIASGETVAVMGPSGSGKSTLLHCLAGLVRPDAGVACIEGTDVWSLDDEGRTRLRREAVGMVFQTASLVDELSAEDNVLLPALSAKVPRRVARDHVRALLAELGVADQATKRPHEMSGGQRQRIGIARALVNEPTVLLADEPTGSLDRQTGDAVLTMMVDAVRQRGGALLIVTHDDAVGAVADRVVHLQDGRVVEQAVRP